MNAAAPWLFPELQGNNQSTLSSSHTFLSPYLYPSLLPTSTCCCLFIYFYCLFSSHLFVVILIWHSSHCKRWQLYLVFVYIFCELFCWKDTSFFCCKMRLLMAELITVEAWALLVSNQLWNLVTVICCCNNLSGTLLVYWIQDEVLANVVVILQCYCIPLPYFLLLSPQSNNNLIVSSGTFSSISIFAIVLICILFGFPFLCFQTVSSLTFILWEHIFRNWIRASHNSHTVKGKKKWLDGLGLSWW